jgi:hypothetical protein
MKLIKQKRNDDCGVACLAMVAGISYTKAMWLLHPWRLPFTNAQTKNKHFQVAFAKLKLNFFCSTDGSIDIKSLRNKALLIIGNSDNTYHGVVWDPERGVVLDPVGWEQPVDYYQENLYQVVEFR